MSFDFSSISHLERAGHRVLKMPGPFARREIVAADMERLAALITPTQARRAMPQQPCSPSLRGSCMCGCQEGRKKGQSQEGIAGSRVRPLDCNK